VVSGLEAIGNHHHLYEKDRRYSDASTLDYSSGAYVHGSVDTDSPYYYSLAYENRC
tara:strand:+ start:203 stop:370 length:168 start_codon:yes stop_codon:yes gene_type:complete